MTDFKSNEDNFCARSIQKCPVGLAILCCILNFPAPGVGTIISAFLAENGMNGDALIVGILQLLFCWTGILWLWSMIHGVLILVKSL